MGKSRFEIWEKLCDENKTIIKKLEQDKGKKLALYSTTKQFEVNHNFFYESPVFHVWEGDSPLYCGMSYIEAIRKYEERQKMGGEIIE